MTKSPDINGPRTYQMIAFFTGSDADLFFHALLERGPKGFLEELRGYHVQGLHDVIPEHELERSSKDPVIEDERYLAWWNVKAGYVGFAFQVFH